MRRRIKRNASKSILKAFLAFIFILLAAYLIYAVFQGNWDGKSRFTIVMQNIDEKNKPKDYNIAIFSIEPREQNGNYIFVNSTFMLDIPYGYKMYPVYSVYKLGELDQKRGGGKLLKKSIETTFGIKTDRFMLPKSKSDAHFPDSKESFLEFKKNNFGIIKGINFLRIMLFETNTDMSFAEKIRFFLSVRNLHSADIKFIDLVKTNAAVLTEFPDGTKMHVPDISVFDYIINSDFFDIRVRNEKTSIEVQNATDQSRIASQFARILEHLGAHVIYTTNAQINYKGNCKIIFYNNASDTSIIGKILKIDYGCVQFIEENKNSQSDLKVIIGEEFLK